jgi:hypothetical protein
MQQISPRDILVEDEERPATARHKAIMAYHDQLEKSLRSMQPKQEKRAFGQSKTLFQVLN